jgi:hypothetical protein
MMPRTFRSSTTILAVASLVLFGRAFGGTAQEKKIGDTAVKAADTVSVVPAPLPDFGGAQFDSTITDLSRIFAGMTPFDSLRFKRLTNTKGWKVHHELFEQNWAKLDKRLQAMTEWRKTELGGISADSATLFYPFSGPDFVNGDLFFPECLNSIYISLETNGEIPAADMNETLFTNFIEDIRASLSTIFVRNYFITSYMSKQFHTQYLKGNLAAFLVFLARRECAVVAVNKIHLDSAGTVVLGPITGSKAARKQTEGMEIQYIKSRPNGQAVHHLYYFPVDISDPSLKYKPQVQAYLRSQKDLVMFTKAASYCMHGDNFSIFRNLCLRSRVILEDDTGIPFKFFTPDAWTVSLYGHYTKPVKDFKYGFQKDLDKAFKDGKLVKPLSYAIGYHWSDGYSSLILAVRKNDSTSTK